MLKVARSILARRGLFTRLKVSESRFATYFSHHQSAYLKQQMENSPKKSTDQFLKYAPQREKWRSQLDRVDMITGENLNKIRKKYMLSDVQLVSIREKYEQEKEISDTQDIDESSFIRTELKLKQEQAEIARASHFKYCIGLAHELEEKRDALRKRAHKVIAMRNILLKQNKHSQEEPTHPSLLVKSDAQKYKPSGIDLQNSSPSDLELYMKQLYEYSRSEKNEAFSLTMEELKPQQITPFIWSLSVSDLLHTNFRKALNQLRNAHSDYIENYLSPELITSLFEQSIVHDSKEGLELLIHLAHNYSFDLSHLNLQRFRALLDFHLSKLDSAFDPDYSTLYLQYYLYQQRCLEVLEKQPISDDNLGHLIQFASQFYKESIPVDGEGEDILFSTVDFLAKSQQLEGLEEEVSSFLMTRISTQNSHIMLHSVLKNAPLRLSQFVISKLKDFKHEHHFLPFSEDALRYFYLNYVKKEKLKCGQFWAFLLREMGLTAQLFDLTTSWKSITHNTDLHTPTLYLSDALLSLNMDPSTAHKQITETLKKFDIESDHPVSIVSMMKAYLKQGQSELAADLASKLVKQSEAQQAQLSTLFHSYFRQNLLSQNQFQNRYGTLLRKLNVQREFEPLLTLISEVLERKDYVSLKWLFNYFSAAHRRAVLLEEISDLKRLKGTTKQQINLRKGAVESEMKLIAEAGEELESIDKVRLIQLQKHIQRKEFLKAAGRSADLGKELAALNEKSQKQLITALHSEVKQSRQLPSPLYSLSDYIESKKIETHEAQVEESDAVGEQKKSKKQFETVHQKVLAELNGVGLKKGSPEYIAMYSAGMLLGKAESGELVGNMEVGHYQKDKKEFKDWMEAQSFLRVISEWLEEYQPLLKRGLYEGSFESYVWDYVVEQEQQGFFNYSLKKGLFLKSTELSYKQLGQIMFNTLTAPEMGEKNMLAEMRKIIEKLPKQYEHLVLRLREQKIIIRDRFIQEISKFNKLQHRDQRAVIENHKLETQRLMSKIIYTSGIQTDLEQIRKEFKQVADALQTNEIDEMKWSEEQIVKKNKEYEGKIDPELSKQLLGFLMLRSRRNKLRLERLRSKLESYKMSENVPVYKYGSASKLFQDILRVQYLQDFNTHGYLVSLPSITDEEIASTVKDRKKMLKNEIAHVKKSSKKRLTLDAARMYKEEWLKEEVEKQPTYRFDTQRQKLVGDGDVRVVSVHAAPGRKRKKARDWAGGDRYLNPFTHNTSRWLNEADFIPETYDVNLVYKIRKAVEKVNLMYSPIHDRYDPHIMRQAAFNTSLLSLKPLLLAELAERKQIAQSYINAQFAKLTRETTFTPQAYELSSEGDVEYRNGQLQVKDSLLSLQKICVMVDDERSPLSIALDRYSHLKDVNPLEVAERVADQSILVEQHTLQELYADLDQKELLMAALENQYLDLLSKTNYPFQESLKAERVGGVQDQAFEQLIGRIYEEYTKVMAQKEDNLKKENKKRKHHGLEKKKELQDDQSELPLVRQMIGMKGRWDEYGEEMMEFGIRQNNPAAIRIGEYLMRGKQVNRMLARRVKEYLEEAQIEYNESMKLTGPLNINDIYPTDRSGQRTSIWRDDYTKLGGLERIIPKEKLEEIRKLDWRLG